MDARTRTCRRQVDEMIAGPATIHNSKLDWDANMDSDSEEDRVVF